MILSDADIILALQGNGISIYPWIPEALQPASVDVHLGDTFLVYKTNTVPLIDPLTDDQADYVRTLHVEDGADFYLYPGQFVLGTTIETVRLDARYVGSVMGRSSLGRLGLIVHSTAGWIDPGFEGKITLEMTNLSPVPIILTPGMSIGQIAFTELKTPATLPYGHPDRNSKYQRQDNVQASKGV